MSTYGCVIVGRNDNYGGHLKERASYAINSCLLTYDEVIYVDWNSRGDDLITSIKENLLKTGKLKCVIVSPDEHKKFTGHFQGAQPCSEVLGRNVGLRRLSTDFLISTNVDEINPQRRYIEQFVDNQLMVAVARRATTLDAVHRLGNYLQLDLIRDELLKIKLPQAWEVTREPYSLVEWCGDLQIAHRDVWYKIKGFEETQLGVGVHDSFVLRKAKEFGYRIEPSYDIPLWHMDHTKVSDYSEPCVPTSVDCLYGDFKGTDNSDNWGLVNYKFKEFII